MAAFTATAAEGRVFVNDLGLVPGQNTNVWAMVETDYDWYSIQFDVKATGGLTVRPYASISDEALAGVTSWPHIYDDFDEVETEALAPQYATNTFSDGSFRVLIFNNAKDPRTGKKYAFKTGKYTLVRLRVRVPADFTEGTITIFNANCPPTTDEGTSTPLPDQTCNVIAAKPLGDIVDGAEDDVLYSPAEDLAVVTRLGNFAFVTDGQGNWMKLAAEGEILNELNKLDFIHSGTIVGTMSESDANQTITLTSTPLPALNAVEYTLNTYSLQGDGSPESFFKPDANEVLNLRGWYFADNGPQLRGYSAAHQHRGQSADLDFTYFAGDNTLVEGEFVQVNKLVAQLKEAWEPENAPSRIKQSDNNAFQNYTLLVTELPEPGTVTGVDNVVSEIAKISVADRTITVAGAHTVAVYNMNGQVLSKQSVTTVEPGIYVVVANGKSTKVLVK
jgi:hypothetical protein